MCPQDCKGKQDEKNPSRSFCCGEGAPFSVGCSNKKCTEKGFQCTTDPVIGSCCGDLACHNGEDSFNCEVDCGPPPACGDGVCNGSEDCASCAVDCATTFTETGLCGDGIDNDCDAVLDCGDPDCAEDAACQCTPKGGSCSSKSDCCSNKCDKKKETCK